MSTTAARRNQRPIATALALVATRTFACGDAQNSAPPPPVGPVGGEERPVDVFVPSTYDGSTAMPLVMLLHSYTITGFAPGAETRTTRYTGCRPGGSVEFWEMIGADHFFILTAEFKRVVVDYFFAHPKP